MSRTLRSPVLARLSKFSARCFWLRGFTPTLHKSCLVELPLDSHLTTIFIVIGASPNHVKICSIGLATILASPKLISPQKWHQMISILATNDGEPPHCHEAGHGELKRLGWCQSPPPSRNSRRICFRSYGYPSGIRTLLDDAIHRLTSSDRDWRHLGLHL